MRKRTQAREIALQTLYQLDRRLKASLDPARHGPGEPGQISVDAFEPFIQESTPDAEVRRHVRSIVDGVIAMLPALDEKIAAAATHWKLHRIAAVDRSILRLAVFEMLNSTEVPPKVAINEAINLAKKYSTEQSGAFVNGILDRIYGQLGKE